MRPSHATLVRRFGEAGAEAVQREAKLAREDLARFIAEEGITCDFALTGQFKGASAAGDYDSLAREADHLRRILGIEAHAVPPAEQTAFLGTSYYQGGSVRMDIGGLHPAKFHAGMLRVAKEAGASIHAETAVCRISPDESGFLVETNRGPVRAREVVLATNGYTDRVDSWLRRRMVPVRSRMIATAPLSDNLKATLMPRRVMCAETRRLHYYYRPSPDGTRILFGGPDGTIAGDPAWPVESLRRAMVDVFPELSDIEIAHSGFGHVAMNRDNLPRVFSHRLKRYAAGHCGSGVVWARWRDARPPCSFWAIRKDVRRWISVLLQPFHCIQAPRGSCLGCSLGLLFRTGLRLDERLAEACIRVTGGSGSTPGIGRRPECPLSGADRSSACGASTKLRVPT